MEVSSGTQLVVKAMYRITSDEVAGRMIGVGGRLPSFVQHCWTLVETWVDGCPFVFQYFDEFVVSSCFIQLMSSL